MGASGNSYKNACIYLGMFIWEHKSYRNGLALPILLFVHRKVVFFNVKIKILSGHALLIFFIPCIKVYKQAIILKTCQTGTPPCKSCPKQKGWFHWHANWLTCHHFYLFSPFAHSQWDKAYQWDHWHANGLTVTPLACQWSHWQASYGNVTLLAYYWCKC